MWWDGIYKTSKKLNIYTTEKNQKRHNTIAWSLNLKNNRLAFTNTVHFRCKWAFDRHMVSRRQTVTRGPRLSSRHFCEQERQGPPSVYTKSLVAFLGLEQATSTTWPIDWSNSPATENEADQSQSVRTHSYKITWSFYSSNLPELPPSAGLPGGRSGKKPPAGAGDLRAVGLIPGPKDPGGGALATPLSVLVWVSHGQRPSGLPSHPECC